MNSTLCVVAALILANVVNSGKIVEQKIEEGEKNTSTEKLIRVQEKLKAVIGKVEGMKSGAKTDHMIQTYTSFVLRYAGRLSEALDFALKVEEKDVDIKNLKYLASELCRTIKNIGNYTKHSKQSKINSDAAEIETTCDNNIVETLNDFLNTNEQQVIETEKEKNIPKEKLEFVKTKVQNVITTLNAIKNEVEEMPKDHFLKLIVLSLEYAGQMSTTLDAALKVEATAVEINNLRYLTNKLDNTIEIIGKYTKKAEHPEKVKELHQSAFTTVTEFSAILKDLQDDLS